MGDQAKTTATLDGPPDLEETKKATNHEAKLQAYELEGWTLVRTRVIGWTNPRTQSVHSHPDYAGVVEILTHATDETWWAYRLPHQGAGSGLRPIGGTSLRSFRKCLRAHRNKA